MKRPVRWLIEFAAPPVALFLVVIVVWHLAVVTLAIKRYVVPLPLEVCWAGWGRRGATPTPQLSGVVRAYLHSTRSAGVFGFSVLSSGVDAAKPPTLRDRHLATTGSPAPGPL